VAQWPSKAEEQRALRGCVPLGRRLTDPRTVELGDATPAAAVRRRERNYRVLLALADVVGRGLHPAHVAGRRGRSR
jgi:hypothetical protein